MSRSISTGRDSAVDLVRALCVLGVIALHALMVGVTVTASGPVFENAAESGSWLTPLSWALQVMPLFFVIGGFAGITSLRRGRSGAAGFAAARVHRLLRPAVAVVAAVGVLLFALAQHGVPDEIVGIAGYRFGQPLWFLGVFLLCQALLPALARLHERHGLSVLLALGGAAGCVEVVRITTGTDALGFLNLAFVWLTLQQLGFFLADGRIDALRRRTRVAAAIGAMTLLAVTFLTGIHSPDLIANLNPPTTALVLVGIAQTAVFSLLRARITGFAERPAPAAFTAFVSERTMTVYLWHMPVLLGLAGILAMAALTTGIALPAPATPEWWLTRPLWLAVAFSLTAVLSLPLARIEAARLRTGAVSARDALLGVLLGLSGVVLLLAVGTTPITAGVSTVLWLAALRIARQRAGEPAIRVGATGSPHRRPAARLFASAGSARQSASGQRVPDIVGVLHRQHQQRQRRPQTQPHTAGALGVAHLLHEPRQHGDHRDRQRDGQRRSGRVDAENAQRTQRALQHVQKVTHAGRACDELGEQDERDDPPGVLHGVFDTDEDPQCPAQHQDEPPQPPPGRTEQQPAQPAERVQRRDGDQQHRGAQHARAQQ